MIELLLDLLKPLYAKGDICGYLINETSEESHQLYFVKDKLETVRDGSSVTYKVTIYVSHDEKMGSSSFLVFPSSREEEIVSLIEEARANASGIYDEPYKLVEGGKEVFGDPKGADLKKEAERIAFEIFSAKGNAGAKLNATEIFLYNIKNRVINSLGVDKTSYSTRGMVETIPTFDKKDESVEIYAQKNFSSLEVGEMKEYIEGKLAEVEARAKVGKIDLPSNLDVLLREEEIETILYEYAFPLTYNALSSGATPFKEGQVAIESKGDGITLTMKGRSEGCSDSRDFDEDGSSLKDRTIIENGVVKSFFGDNRFSQYAKKDNTGNLRILSLSLGSLDEKCIEGDYLECLQFSGIQADLYNDYLGGEVRLALYHHDGKAIPVGGFSISGKLSELLSSALLSKHLSKEPSYSGPRHIYLKKMSVL